MSEKVAELYVEIGAKMGDLKREMDGLKTTLGKPIEPANKLGASLGGVAIKMLAVATAYVGLRGIKSLATSFFDAATETENYRVRLGALLGTQKLANEAMEFFQDIASQVPFTLQDVIKAGTTLTAMGADYKKWTGVLTDLAAVMELDLPTAASAMGRAFAGGAGAADIFRETGILQIIRDSAKMKSGIDDITKLTLPQFRDAMYDAFTDPDGKISGAADNLAKTWDGMVSMLGDTWFQFRQGVMESGLFDYLKNGLEAVLGWIGTLKKEGRLDEWAADVGQGIVSVFDTLLSGVDVVSKSMGGLKILWFQIAAEFTEVAFELQLKIFRIQLELSKIFPPLKIGLKEVANNVVALAAEVKAYRDKAQEAGDKTKLFTDSFKDLRDRLQEVRDNADKVVGDTGKGLKGIDNTLKNLKGSVNGVVEVLGMTGLGGSLHNLAGLTYNVQSEFKDAYVYGVKYWADNTKKTVDNVKSYWRDITGDLSRAFGDAFADMITTAKNFGEFMTGLSNAMLRVFSTALGKLVTDALTDFKKLKAGWQDAVEGTFLAFAAYVSVNLVNHLLGVFGLVKNEWDALSDQIRRDAARLNEEVRNTISKDESSPRQRPGEPTPRAKDPADILGYLDRIPKALKDLIESTRTNLFGLSKITSATFHAMIAEGRGYWETLNALKEPMDALFERYKGGGIQGPFASFFELFKKMEEAPAAFKKLDAARTILESLSKAGYLTQNTFDALSNSTRDFARAIFGVKTNLNESLKAMVLTQDQIQQMAPVVAQFVGMAAAFGLGVPGWMKTFVTKHLGVDWDKFKEDAAARANAGVQTVRKLEGVWNQLDALRTKKLPTLFGNLELSLVNKLDGVIGAIDRISLDDNLYSSAWSASAVAKGNTITNLTVTPEISVVVTPQPIILDGKQIALVTAPHTLKLSKLGYAKFSERGIIN